MSSISIQQDMRHRQTQCDTGENLKTILYLKNSCRCRFFATFTIGLVLLVEIAVVFSPIPNGMSLSWSWGWRVWEAPPPGAFGRELVTFLRLGGQVEMTPTRRDPMTSDCRSLFCPSVFLFRKTCCILIVCKLNLTDFIAQTCVDYVS